MTNLRDDLQAALGAAYALEEELGGGGMSRVFVAREIALGRRVVVKVLPPELVAGVNVERFRREIQVAAQLRHPHIVPVLAAGESNGLLYYTMPFVEGESLRDRLSRQGELPVDEAVRILREIAEALAHAHRRGVVHRDIKPENVLLEEGNAQVADFGIAKALTLAAVSGSLTSVGVAVGTPAYMAPEQAAADPHTDHRADIYSFGAVAYELLTGQAPFGLRSPQALLAAHITEAPDPVTKLRQSVPTSLAAMVMSCLEKRPSDRPQSAEELILELDNVRAAHGKLTGDAPLSARHPSVGRGFHVRRAAMIAGAAATLALAGYFMISARNSREPANSGTAGRADSASGATAAPTTSTAAAPPKSIAVLPFANVSADPDNEYFSDGLTDELITALSGIDGLRVAARTSAFALKRKELDVRIVGNTLNVATVLTGSVRKAGARIRVTAQLVNAADGYELWSHSYDSKLRDVFSVQDTISRAIVNALRVNLVAGSETTLVRPPTDDLAAYELYLKGQYFWSRRIGDDLRTAVRYFEQAIARDAKYAQAYSGLADAYTLLAIRGYRSWREVMPSAMAAARKALELDSTLVEARVSVALVRMVELDPTAPLELKRIIAMHPEQVYARHLYGIYLGNQGLFDEAILELKRALSLDPLSTGLNATLARVYVNARRPDEAIRQADKGLELNPRFSRTLEQLGYAYLQKKMFPEAISAFGRAAALGNSSDSAHLAYGYAVTGRRAEAVAILRVLLEQSKRRYVPAFSIATVYAGLGDSDQTFQWLDRAWDERSGTLAEVRTMQAFDSVRSDPRFPRFLTRIWPEP